MRVASAVLIGVSLMTLTACSGDDTPAAVATPPAAAPTGETADPAATTPPAAEPVAAAPSDKKLCEGANTADKAMKAELIKAMQSSGGDLPAADTKKILTGLATKLMAAGESDTKVGAAVKEFVAQTTAAASAADPMAALDNPAYEKAGKGLTAACKTAGVTVNY